MHHSKTSLNSYCALLMIVRTSNTSQFAYLKQKHTLLTFTVGTNRISSSYFSHEYASFIPQTYIKFDNMTSSS